MIRVIHIHNTYAALLFLVLLLRVGGVVLYHVFIGCKLNKKN